MQDNKYIKKIEIIINDRTIELSADEAIKLYQELKELFESSPSKETIQDTVWGRNRRIRYRTFYR